MKKCRGGVTWDGCGGRNNDGVTEGKVLKNERRIMGFLDRKQKEYFEDPRRFADIWNAFVFQGRKVLDGSELQEGSPVMTHADRKGRAGGKGGVERIADLVTKRTFGGQVLAVYILENYENVDYTMPAKVMLEEALSYEKQVREIRRKNSESEKGLKTSGEYLYGFGPEDKLCSVVTLVLNFREQ